MESDLDQSTKPARPICRAWTKAIQTESGPPRYSAEWIAARRCWFKVFADRVQFGDTAILAEEVQEAVLYETRQWFIPAFILAITTAGETWQFGFNPWAKVVHHLPFPVRREKVRLKYSSFSVAVRVGLILYLIYILIRRWGGG